MQSLRVGRIYLPELDGLRFFAFFLVFVHHHSLFGRFPILQFLHNFGWIGVDLFFALSAFLFTRLLIAEHTRYRRIDFKKFYLRRIFRIYPIYFLFILSIAFISQSGGIRLAGLLTFTDNIMTAYSGRYNPLLYQGHLWTISYEEQFYLIIPFLIPALISLSKTKKLMVLLFTFTALNVLRLGFIRNDIPHPAIWVLPITHFESILLGIVIGFGGLDFLLKKISPLLVGVIGIYFFISLCFLPTIDSISYYLVLPYTLVGLSTTLVLYAVLNSNSLQSIFSYKLFVFLGKRSYALYVFHILGNGIGDKYAEFLPITSYAPLNSFILSLAFTIVLSIISYKYIETPFLKLKSKFELIKSRPI